MARLANGKLHIITVLDADDFLACFEGRAAAGNEISVGVVRMQALDKQILHIRIGIGEAPSEVQRASEDRQREAGQGGAGDIQPWRADMGEIPKARNLQSQMRIVGEERMAAHGMFAGEHPIVGAETLGLARR